MRKTYHVPKKVSDNHVRNCGHNFKYFGCRSTWARQNVAIYVCYFNICDISGVCIRSLFTKYIVLDIGVYSGNSTQTKNLNNTSNRNNAVAFELYPDIIRKRLDCNLS